MIEIIVSYYISQRLNVTTLHSVSLGLKYVPFYPFFVLMEN